MGLKSTWSSTTWYFAKFEEKNRVKKEMEWLKNKMQLWIDFEPSVNIVLLVLAGYLKLFLKIINRQ